MNESIAAMYTCFHPQVGYLAFNSYSRATAATRPCLRGLFSRLSDAKRRRDKGEFFYVRDNRYHCSDIVIKHVHIIIDVMGDLNE